VEFYRSERVLVVSFLYPEDYYQQLRRTILRLLRHEYADLPAAQQSRGRIRVLALYPGFLLPNDLFNKIDSTLEAAELSGDPFTAVLIDGIHNSLMQFPKIGAD
jgi:hypothetical protein